ncbi:putative short-chain dehydrogenase [Cryphonectria parasitica EP155]|uniref:Short-chain dehydrogenase n=1 Tax=Cryphonectria parasitica (strain ATCC 38755 / EP155) TaxID=660469 RepID=A0A9P4Y2X0_CRYP1|nr:putative short-chain dehydrogenase [Cryphonectria parasitica EP155]KAF3765581.1 putative short-chain dehydrogenase [Cryphonectria parasitica EP155]
MVRSYDKQATAESLVNDLAAQIKDKVILTTGVSPHSIGATFVETIAKAQPRLLILAGRSLDKTQQTADAITKAHPKVQVRLLQLDLGSLQAVREAAATVNGWDDVPQIDVLVNNAGIMAVPKYALSPDGFEITFATNHLGHFLFTNLILDKILASKTKRVVSVSSEGHRLSPIRWGDYNFRNGETFETWRAYGQSKTANMLFALALAEKLGTTRGLSAFSVHPGVVPSNLGRHLDFSQDQVELRAVDASMGNREAWEPYKYKTEQEGAATHVYAAFEPTLAGKYPLMNGTYLEDSHIADPWVETVKPWATSNVEAQRLWKLTEELIGQKFEY